MSYSEITKLKKSVNPLSRKSGYKSHRSRRPKKRNSSNSNYGMDRKLQYGVFSLMTFNVEIFLNLYTKL